MTLRTWWLRNKLGRLDAKLKRLRAQQRVLRQRGDEAAKARLHEVTERVHRLTGEEERVKAELAGSEGGAASA